MQGMSLVMIPEEEWLHFKEVQRQILERIKSPDSKEAAVILIKYITAIEFMEAVRIKRTKFDKLVQTSKIKIIKKGRKIYVPVGEVERFFSDRTIE